MFIDAMFSISHEGIKIIKKMESNKRFDYILGVDDDDFVGFMINICDFGIDQDCLDLCASEMNFLKLNIKHTEELYRDERFYITCMDYFQVEELKDKIDNIDFDILKKCIDYEENNITLLCGKYEKFQEMKELVNEAYKEQASILLVIRRL